MGDIVPDVMDSTVMNLSSVSDSDSKSSTSFSEDSD
jgi:hypothetical protein